MFFSFHQLGPLKAAQALSKRVCSAATAKYADWNRSTTLVEISIDGTGCSQAAFGRRPQSTAHPLHFLFRQVTSAPAS
jgi:hypothetical protein